MRFGSVCSGIEAASVAWHPLGWKAAWLSEIEPFPSAVLTHHYPDVPNLGDMTALPNRILSGEVEAPDVFCGGTPCQAFSVAGLRNSLDDARGNLSLTFCEIANAIDTQRIIAGLAPSIVFWENVPGVLNTKDNAFGCFLAELAGESTPLDAPRGKWPNAGCILGPQRTVAWRVLDAQYFGVAQRRRRVFVVASARDDFNPAAVLFESEGVRRDSAPSREARKDITECAGTLTANGGELNRPAGNANELDFCVTVAKWPAEVSSTLDTDGGTQAVAVGTDCYNGSITGDVAATMGTPGSSINASGPTVMQGMAVRRLTPVECERLQGFPDNYTRIPWRANTEANCPDGPRYKALGNSWAVPVVRWIGRRIVKELKNADT
jgi:DNA (cytosine-5)-methyltransferase 1